MFATLFFLKLKTGLFLGKVPSATEGITLLLDRTVKGSDCARQVRLKPL
jgi:hypothetical protein